MKGRTRVLSERNGPTDASVLFVAEAPGRFGADRLGVPLAGDRTGRTFEQLLASADWTRDDVFISNAVLCNPRDDLGRNRPPAPTEVQTCSAHLRALIGVVDPSFVVTLGATALGATNLIERHDLVLRAAVGKPVDWFGRVLVPLYHPGPRALIHRSLETQRRDYARLGRLVRHATSRAVA